MKIKDKDAARQILNEVDVLSESAALMNDTIESLKENGGTVKLFVHTDGKDTVTELDKNTAVTVMREIVKIYNGEIISHKTMLEVVIRNTVVELY
ncbi:MAG: hypothetical protein RR590_03415 [Hungatella sp.]